MPFTSPTVRLRALERELQALGKPDGIGQKMILRGILDEVRELLRGEFQSSTGPNGPWAKTKRGRDALRSDKLPYSWTGKIEGGGVHFLGRVARDWLEAHQFGHEFPEKHVGKNEKFFTLNRQGARVKNFASKLVGRDIATRKGRYQKIARAIDTKTGKAKRGWQQVFNRAHTVGKRVLLPRPMYPEGTLSGSWEAAVSRGAEAALAKWMQHVARE